jgi:hypothetical protein
MNKVYEVGRQYFLEKLVCHSVGCKRCFATDSALVCRSNRALFVVMMPDSSWFLCTLFILYELRAYSRSAVLPWEAW